MKMMSNDRAKSQFVYVTYIKTTPEKLWAALTKPEFIKEYWFGVTIETEWKPGSSWRMLFEDGRLADSGEILECVPGELVVIKWRNEWKPELKEEGYGLCRMEIEAAGAATKLTVTHSIDVSDSKYIGAVSGGWPKILSNLKSLLETGAVVLASK